MEANVDLFITNVGSHLWGMETEESDIDYFVCYQAPTADILRGTVKIKSEHRLVGKDDRAIHELGHVVNHVLKGNFNFLLGVMSPIVVQDWPLLVQDEDNLNVLRMLTKRCLSRKCYKSIHGLYVANTHKYIRSGKDNTPKRRNLIARSLKFGITLLEKKEFVFEAVRDATPEDLNRLSYELDAALQSSPLPEEPSAGDEAAIREFLLQCRKENLRGSKRLD